MTDSTIGSIVIRWHMNVGGYKLESGVLSIKVVADDSEGGHPIRGILGGTIAGKNDVWLTIDLER